MARRMTIAGREIFLAGPRVGICRVSCDGDRPPLAVPIWYGREPGGAVTFARARWFGSNGSMRETHRAHRRRHLDGQTKTSLESTSRQRTATEGAAR